MVFTEMTVREYFSTEPSTCELMQVQSSVCGVIERAKLGDDDAFIELLNTKDMRAFIKFVTARVLDKLNYDVAVDAITHEVNLAIYDYLNRCYTVKNQPNELQVLISSLGKWLPSNVSCSLYDMVKPKQDETLSIATELQYAMTYDVDFTLFLAETLTHDEYQLFEAKYIDGKTNVQISKELCIVEGTVRYKNKKLLEKLKLALTA